jgi:hypothetical protein
MLTVEDSRWGHDPDLVRVLGLKAEHPRTRERFLALSASCGEKHVRQGGRETGRNPPTVMAWGHRYHTVGPAALLYPPTGGRPPCYPAPGTGHRSSESRGPEAGRNPAPGADRTARAAVDAETVAGLAPGAGSGRGLSGADPAGAPAVRRVLEKSPEPLESSGSRPARGVAGKAEARAEGRHPWPTRARLY